MSDGIDVDYIMKQRDELRRMFDALKKDYLIIESRNQKLETENAELKNLNEQLNVRVIQLLKEHKEDSDVIGQGMEKVAHLKDEIEELKKQIAELQKRDIDEQLEEDRSMEEEYNNWGQKLVESKRKELEGDKP